MCRTVQHQVMHVSSRNTNTIHQQNVVLFTSKSSFFYLYIRFHDWKSYMYSKFPKCYKVRRCAIWTRSSLSASIDTRKIIGFRRLISNIRVEMKANHKESYSIKYVCPLLYSKQLKCASEYRCKNHWYAKMRTQTHNIVYPSTTFVN